MTARAPWTDAENAANVALYFAMLDKAIAGEKYSKAQMIRHTQTLQLGSKAPPLAARSRGSIEFKLMNCSAAHAALDPAAVTMHGFGYRAQSNYQKSLKDAMRRALDNRESTRDVRNTPAHLQAIAETP